MYCVDQKIKTLTLNSVIGIDFIYEFKTYSVLNKDYKSFIRSNIKTVRQSIKETKINTFNPKEQQKNSGINIKNSFSYEKLENAEFDQQFKRLEEAVRVLGYENIKHFCKIMSKNKVQHIVGFENSVIRLEIFGKGKDLAYRNDRELYNTLKHLFISVVITENSIILKY